MSFIDDALNFRKEAHSFVFGIEKIILNPIKAIKDWMTPDSPAKEALKIQRKGSNLPIKLVYGTRIVGADIVDENVSDESGGVQNENYHVLAVFCHGEVEEIEEVFFNGVSWDDPQWEKSNGDKWFTYELRKGGVDNLTPMGGADKFNNWSDSTSLYQGLCVGIFTFEQSEDENVWGGEPQITARIKGKKCYDWRTGTTEYTENPVVHLVDYLKSDVYGLGLDDSLIDYTNNTIVADVCGVSETSTVTTRTCEYDDVTGDGNLEYICTTTSDVTETFARFSNNTIIDTGNKLFDNVKEIANSFRGFFPDNSGLFSVATESEATSVMSFTDDEIIGGISTTSTSKNERYNQVTVSFPNILNNYEMDEVVYPETDSTEHTQWLLEDNGTDLEYSVSSETIVYKAEALQLAEVIAKVSRNNDQIAFTASALAIELDVGDVIDITNSTRGWVNVEFRVDNITLNDNYTVTITATLHNNTVYPWTDYTYNEYIGGSNLGNPNDIATPDNLSLTPDTTLSTTGLLTWDHDSNAFTRSYLVKAIVGGETVLSQPCDTKSFTVPLLASGDYTFEVYAKNTLGKASFAGTLLATLSAPNAPTNIIADLGDWDIEAKPVLAGAGLGTVFDFDYVDGDGVGYSPVAKSQGYNVVITGLIPDTQYTIYTRAVNAYGISDWYSESFTTTDTGEQVAPFLQTLQDEIDSAQSQIDNLDSTADVLTIDEINLIGQGISDAWQNQLRIDEIRTTNEEVEATVTKVDLIEIDADNNAQAISAITAGVTGQEDYADALLILDSLYADGGVSARAFFGTDVNNRITGVNIQGEPDNGVISFIGDKVEFLRPDDFSVAFQWDDTNDTFVFDGKIISTDATITGTITGSTINGGDITGANIKSSTSGQRVEIEGTTQKFYPATGTDYVSLDGEDVTGSGLFGAALTINSSTSSTGLVLKNDITNSYCDTFITGAGQILTRYVDTDDNISGFINLSTLHDGISFGGNGNEFICGATDGATLKSDKRIEIDCDSSSATSGVEVIHDGQVVISTDVGTGGQFCSLYRGGIVKLSTSTTGITVFGVVNETSDPKIKDFHRKLDGKESLQKILDVDLYEYHFKDVEKYGTGLQVGVNAEQASEVFEDSVIIGDDDLLSFNYKAAYIHGLAAIKELTARVEALEKLINK